MDNKTHMLTAAQIDCYANYLYEQERAESTIRKYRHDLTALLAYLGTAPLTKAVLIGWKEHLLQRHAPSSVNSMLAAVNSFFSFMGWPELKLRPLKIQKALFCDEQRELTRSEYIRLVQAASQQGNERLSLVLQTICSTGIRVSELRFITAEAVASARVEIVNKGKLRTIFLSDKLRRLLKKYLQKEQRTAGAVFVTSSGRPLDRSNIWRDMKAVSYTHLDVYKRQG